MVNKPAGWLSIPGRDSPDGKPSPYPVLSEWASDDEARFTGVPEGRVWVVHRLDVETSGVMLFARSAAAHKQAGEWFMKHQVKKTYDAIAQGLPGAPVFRVNEPIEGARAVTQVEVRERLQGAFLARVRIVTGKRHQIRIHLANSGFPVWGDERYGGSMKIDLPGGPLSVERVALHSAKLELPGGETFEAAWPEDFQRWLTAARPSGANEWRS